MRQYEKERERKRRKSEHALRRANRKCGCHDLCVCTQGKSVCARVHSCGGVRTFDFEQKGPSEKPRPVMCWSVRVRVCMADDLPFSARSRCKVGDSGKEGVADKLVQAVR